MTPEQTAIIEIAKRLRAIEVEMGIDPAIKLPTMYANGFTPDTKTAKPKKKK